MVCTFGQLFLLYDGADLKHMNAINFKLNLLKLNRLEKTQVRSIQQKNSNIENVDIIILDIILGKTYQY